MGTNWSELRCQYDWVEGQRREGQENYKIGKARESRLGRDWGRVQLEALYLRAGRREPGWEAPGSPAQVRRRSGRSTGGARAGGGGGNPPPTRNCRLGKECTSLRDTPDLQTSPRLPLAPPPVRPRPSHLICLPAPGRLYQGFSSRAPPRMDALLGSIVLFQVPS